MHYPIAFLIQTLEQRKRADCKGGIVCNRHLQFAVSFNEDRNSIKLDNPIQTFPGKVMSFKSYQKNEDSLKRP